MRGLKRFAGGRHDHNRQVASFTDAWIETRVKDYSKSHLFVASFTDAWIETSLVYVSFIAGNVASFTDAWIETIRRQHYCYRQKVASFTDAWIETEIRGTKARSVKSHLLQMRGLKHLLYLLKAEKGCRIFYRCVD